MDNRKASLTYLPGTPGQRDSLTAFTALDNLREEGTCEFGMLQGIPQTSELFIS